MPKYYDNWQNEDFKCPKCAWAGKGAALESGEVFSDLKELDCPQCGGRITILEFATYEEMAANRAKLSQEDRESLERRERREAEFERQCLRNLDQLPDVAEPSFVLMWDFSKIGDATTVLIKFGSQVLFREPAFYEDSARFVEVAEILRRRYGAAIQDLVPTRASLLYLFGDDSSAPKRVNEARVRIFGAHPVPLK